MIARYVLAVCIVFEAIGCGGGDDRQDGPTLDEIGAAQVSETCADLDEAMRNDDEAVEGLCRVYAAAIGIQASASNGAPEDAVSVCETSFPSCPRQTLRSVCIDSYLDSSCDATLADLMSCAERIRELYRAHARETCEEAVGDRLGTRAAPTLPPSKVCERVFACFQPLKFDCPADAGTAAVIIDADDNPFPGHSAVLSCP